MHCLTRFGGLKKCDRLRRITPGGRRVVDIKASPAVDEQRPKRMVREAVYSQNPPLAADPRSDREHRMAGPAPARLDRQLRIFHPLIIPWSGPTNDGPPGRR